MAKVSIVVPVYNCEQYLEQCIGSALSQTLADLEVICVDDGSTDQSAQVLHRLMAEDSRVVAFRQENRGPGAARNLGLDQAKGEYICFLDADDFYVERDALEKMYQICREKQVDACVSLRWLKGGEREAVESFFQGREGQVISYKDCQVDYNFMNYMFKTGLLREKGLYFPLYRRYEDPPFLIRALYAAGGFSIADTCLYCYRMPDAVQRFRPEIVQDLLRGIMDSLEFARGYGLSTLYRNTLERLEYEYMYIILKNIVPDDLGVLRLLLQADWMAYGLEKEADQAADCPEGENHVIRPLRALLLFAGRYGRTLLDKVRVEKQICLYGAGRMGRALFNILEENGLSEKVVRFVVSDMEGNQDFVKGVPVEALGNLPRGEERLVLVAAGAEKHREITESLEGHGWKNHEVVREEFLCMAAEEMERQGKLWQNC